MLVVSDRVVPADPDGRPNLLERLRPSDGEAHFLWHFMQGSIMVPETRRRLRRAWGMCARHSFGAVAVEAAFRPRFLHGPALLYEDMMERAVTALKERPGPFQAVRLARRLRAAGPCLMCELGYAQTPPLPSHTITCVRARTSAKSQRLRVRRRRAGGRPCVGGAPGRRRSLVAVSIWSRTWHAASSMLATPVRWCNISAHTCSTTLAPLSGRIEARIRLRTARP
jgi:hypothetical protein